MLTNGIRNNVKTPSMADAGIGSGSFASDAATPNGAMKSGDLLTSHRSVASLPLWFDESATAECTIDHISNESSGTQNIFLCSINGRLLHEQRIHIVTGDGKVLTPQPVVYGVETDRDQPAAVVPPAPTRRPDHFPQPLHPPRSEQWPHLAGPAANFHQQLLQQQHLLRVIEYGGSAADMMLTVPTARAPSRYSPYAAIGYQSSAEHLHRSFAKMTPKRYDNNAINTIREALQYELQPLQANRLKHDVGGINLEEIKEFAKAFKMKRLSLGITQTQVGAALQQAEGPSYSQSAICRFENMDITPKSAQKIKPVLEKWICQIEAKIQVEKDRRSLGDNLQPCEKRSSILSAPLASTLALPTALRASDDADDQRPTSPCRVNTPVFRIAEQQAPPLWSQSSMVSMSSRTATLTLPTILQPSEADLQVQPFATSAPRNDDDAPLLADDTNDEYRLICDEHRIRSYHSSMLLDVIKKRKRRTSFTPQALHLLNFFFELNAHPTGAEITLLAENVLVDREVVRVWFCNKRQAVKNTAKKIRHRSSVGDSDHNNSATEGAYEPAVIP